MKQQTKGGALHKVWQALPWLWMAAAYLFDLWYQLVPGKWIVDSDLASEMILSDLLNKEGTIISHNWFYSTELKVVNLQWFYRLGLRIFPNDWHLARTFGMAITLALFAAAMLFFVKCAGLGRAGLWMVGTLLWPFGQHYLVYAIYGGYYLVYTFFYMLVLALVLRSLNADKKHCALQWVLACVITAVAGMNGVKQLMVFHAPLCLAAAILLVLALHSCGKTNWKAALDASRKEVRLFAASLVTAVAAAAGYFVSNAVLSRMYDFKSYNFIVWNRDEDWFTLDRILMDFFHEFGYENGSGVFHFGGIAAAVGLLLGCWMFFCIVRLLLRLDKLERNDKLLVLLLVAMLAVCGVAYTYFHEYYLYFWLMNMPVAIAVMAVEIKTEDFHILGARQLLGVGLAACFTLCAVSTVRQEQEHPYLAHKGLNTAAEWLVDNGYTQGYSTFWNGNAMTELTSGKLEVWTLQSLDRDDVPNWLQPKSHLTTDPEHPFLLIDTETDGPAENAKLIQYGDCTEVYNDGRYVIYDFADADALHAAAQAAADAKQ
ncbi:hypothetical protein GPK89_01110 [Gemmiger formicilis]|uniref:hypothetical protein n=1 Tax=Gemmiger formicilis TaxID=745368 RepID=UPI001C00E543|nr:hypothetical protein [Gemmiger formicilis]MBT9673337.1 hypothetical protein [Gemmiger formicilis]